MTVIYLNAIMRILKLKVMFTSGLCNECSTFPHSDIILPESIHCNSHIDVLPVRNCFGC